MCSLAVQGHASTWFKHVLPAAYFALGTVGSMLTTPNSGCQSWKQKMMIKMGMASAYDFKKFFGLTVLLGTALAAASHFGGDAPADKPTGKKDYWKGGWGS
jgi:hypothetical protein